MILMAVLGLYTSRIFLRELGITDYGINNVVGSLLALLTYISGPLASSASRFFAFEIGKGEKGELNKYFSTTINIHLIFSFLLLIVGETIGLWYLNNKLVIPPERIHAATVVYHMSIVGTMLSLMVVPYNALIIAHEHMKAFAYLSIGSAIFKLATAYFLCITPFDKLITISVLGVCFGAVVNFLYFVYCQKHFVEVRYKRIWDKNVFKEIMAFSGWSMASYVPIGVTQVLNLLINAYFGPVLNAAKGISDTVKEQMYSFALNFMVAVNPQIVKSCAANNNTRLYELVEFSEKVSFTLLLLIMTPILYNIDNVLHLWLVEVPEHTPHLVIIVCITSIFRAVSNPLGVIAEAKNRIKLLNCISVPYYILSLPASYLLLECGASVEMLFLLLLLCDYFHFVIKAKIANRISGLPFYNQILTYTKYTIVIIFFAIIGYGLTHINYGVFIDIFWKSILSLTLCVFVCYFFILNLSDRLILRHWILSRISHG